MTAQAATTGRGRKQRTGALNMVSTTAAFLRMDFIEEISYPISSVFRQLRVVTPLFIFFFIGQLVADSPRVGGDYLTFIVIGISLSAVMQGAMAGFGGSLQRAFQRGNLETLLVEPVPWTFLPFAMNLWQAILGVFSGALLMGVGVLLGANYVLSGLPLFVLIAFLGILASVAIGVLSAAVLMLTLKSQPLLHLYGLAASLLAGSLFSVDQLPSWLKVFSWAIPHTYVINGARQALMVDSGTFQMSMTTVIVALVGFNVVVLSLGLWLFRRSLEYARTMGLLSGY